MSPPKWTRAGSGKDFNKRYASGTHGRELKVPIELWRKYGVVLLWSAVGIDLLISKAGYPLLGQSISVVCVMLYLAEYVSLRKAMCSFWFTMMDVFFREISTGGTQKVKALDDGRAVIFACAPHVNQFVDPIVVMKVVAQVTGRHVSWMTAAKSFNRAVIGDIAKAIKAIPVVRPEDNEQKGKGFITTDGTKVFGHAGTQFMQDFGKGSVLVVKGKRSKRTGKVARVISDDEMELSAPMREQVEVVKVDKKQDFHRAPSEKTTVLLVVVFFIPLIVGLHILLQSQQAAEFRASIGLSDCNFLPVEVLLSLQLSCTVVNQVYHLMRLDFSKKKDEGGKGQEEAKAEEQQAAAAAAQKKKEQEQEQAASKDVDGVKEKAAYSFLPYVDQSEMFEQVYCSLLNGGTIGIFPEGGTHDGTTLLPLKWGISTMLLGALAKHHSDSSDAPPPKISVVPIGLNYFRPHDFRSTVSVDFGDPIEVDMSLAEQWRDGTKQEQQEANIAVMELIMAGVNACTLQAKDVETLELFRTIRRLYVPLGARLSVADNVALTQGVAYGFEKIKHDAKVQDFTRRVASYGSMLRELGVRDYQVQRFQAQAFSKRQRTRLLLTAVYRLCVFLLFGVLLLPWYVCVAPAALVVSAIADQQARKVNKRSVMGTWKVLAGVGFVPPYHLFTTACIWLTLGDFAGLTFFFLAPFFGIIAIVATEDGFRLFRSLRSLLFVLKNKDAGQQLCVLRESLRNELFSLQEDYHWLHRLDVDTKERLEKRQSMMLMDSEVAASLEDMNTN